MVFKKIKLVNVLRILFYSKTLFLFLRRFFLKSALPISEELRREVGHQVKSKWSLEPPVKLFDEAQAQIEHLISNTTYPNFLKSDMYLHYIQSVQHQSGSELSAGESSSSSCSSSSNSLNGLGKDFANMAASVGPLPIIHEDMEFTGHVHTPGTGYLSAGYHTPNLGAPRLTKDMLLVTQKHRAMDVRPKPEAFAE